MAGWNKKKTAAFREAFSDFLQYVVIDSKETGEGVIQLLESQRIFLRQVMDGLAEDKHWFVILKARQLGISTIVRALIVFWAYFNRGLRVALVFDTDDNKNDARAEIRLMLARLPRSHSIPIAEGGDNRSFLQLDNGSRISYMVAGIKRSRGSGGLGRSRGINCCGCTEMSSWADIEGLRAFERSLAQGFDNRLFIFESTARGPNIFKSMWEEAEEDDLTKVPIFIGWWAKWGVGVGDYLYEKDTPLFERYGIDPPSEEEQQKIGEVEKRFGHLVTMEQLAWYRHQHDPTRDEKDKPIEGQEILQQELPWTPEEAFILSGSQFFPVEKLSNAMKAIGRTQPKGYKYYMSDDFTATEIGEMAVARHGWLKVWEEPDPSGVYVIGADPAYGSSDTADRYCLEVLRCYADGVDQVAEFCVAQLATYQFAWVIAHLGGAYANARLLLELNGPGHAVLNAFRELEGLMKHGYLREEAEKKGLMNIFDHIRPYLWARQDSLTRAPTAYHWETNTKRKVMVMERLRDFLISGGIRIRSMEALVEMQNIVRDGDEIRGEGSNKDDRVMALALALHAWESHERPNLIRQRRTRDQESKRKALTENDLHAMFQQSLVANFFERQTQDRIAAMRRAQRGNRWNW